MNDFKDSTPKGGFFRKVVRFALNPTTDWADLNSTGGAHRETDEAKSELKAMIERKRRNDFVRKRELDMLRKIRRDGVTGEGLAGLEGLSRLDDSEVRLSDGHGARADHDVKDKIDAIERQMSVETGAALARRGSAVMRASAPAMTDSFFSATTVPQIMAPASADAFKPTTPMDMTDTHGTRSRGLPAGSPHGGHASPAQMMSQGVSALSPLHGGDNSNAFAVEVTELAHDPELDEAVIAFANADFDQCERTLLALTGAGGDRAQHSETWLATFDLYRATGQQAKFDAMAMDYVQRFGWSPPQWYSLPRLVAESAQTRAGLARPSRPGPIDSAVGWVAPETLDLDTVAELRSQLLQMPLPWVLDWRQVRQVDPQSCSALNRLLQDWADETIEMTWVGGEKFLALLAELSPTGLKDIDPAFWLLRLESLRLTNRAADFDQVAIDYCLTYEVSPPSWSPSRCTLRMSSGSGVTVAAPGPMSMINSGFAESETLHDSVPAIARVELQGQLIGDIGARLKQLDQQIGTAGMVQVSCERLIRIDFIAAGDLLNWVLTRRGENRSVSFSEAHRLVALFCGAMGITEHARVTVRTV
jgi:hypothetical protein